jgi:hypothetical protein
LSEVQLKLIDSLDKVDGQIFVDIGESKYAKDSLELAKIFNEDQQEKLMSINDQEFEFPQKPILNVRDILTINAQTIESPKLISG